MKTNLLSSRAVLLMAISCWLTLHLAPARAGVIVDDTWADGTRTNTALPNETAWFASSANSLTNYAPGSMTGISDLTASRTWLTYFTTNPAVDLAVGETLKVTLVFIPTNVAVFAGGTQYGLRFGLFDFADGGTRATADGTFVGGTTGSGTNVTGYMLNQSFYTVFPVDGPMQFWARTNLPSGNLMGSTVNFYGQVGASGPAGYLNAPGFVSGMQYTLEFSAARTASNSVTLSARITGTNLDLFNSFIDTNYFCHRFDCFAVRTGNATNSAASLTFKEFRIELSGVPGVIVDDTWADGDRTDTDLPDETTWFACSAANYSYSTATLTNYAPGSMTGISNPTNSCTWLTYFTTNPATPVDLAAGEILKVTLVFIPTNVAVFAGGTQFGLRVGLFDFADGGTRATADGFPMNYTAGSATNVTGYLLNQSFYTIFPVDAPMEFWARTNMPSGNLMGSTANDYLRVGASGPAGYSNAPGFVSGMQYTLEFSAARTVAHSVEVSARITAGTNLDLFNSVTDTNFVYNRFDCFTVRPATATNSAASFTFKEFKVEVLSGVPVIAVQPTNQSVQVNDPATFTVSATGPGPLSYQWRLNGANIPGATSSTFSLTSVQLGDCGSYDVLVANRFGVVASLIATLKVPVAALPFADNFANRGSTNGLSGVGGGSNTNATREAGEPYHAYKYGNHSVWLQWTAPADGVATFNTRGSSFDTLLAVYTGTSLSSLTIVAANDDEGNGRFTSQVQFNAAAGTTYIIAVDGLGSANGDIVLSWNLVANVAQIPMITTQPADVTVSAGGTAFFSVSATCNTNLTYQWYYNDSLAIAGVTNALLTISNVGPTNVGLYRVEITSATGQTVVSDEVSLEIGPFAGAHSFDKLEDLLASLSGGKGFANLGGKGFLAALSGGFPSVSVGGFGSQLINNFGSTTSQGEPLQSTNGGASRWYLVTAATNGTMIIDTMGSSIATQLTVYTNYGALFPSIIGKDVNSAPDGHSLLRFLAVPGTNYLIQVDGVGGAQSNIWVNWRMGVPPNTVRSTQSFAIVMGTNLLFSAGESNNVTSPTYQWRCNGVNLGATNATLSLTNSQFNQCGIYSVVVSNLVGVVTNVIALVSVDPPLKLAAVNPAYICVCATQAVVLQLSTNLTSWQPLFTNQTVLLPTNYLDTGSTNHDKSFYRLKPWQ
jgi:hypothetical protein